MVHFPHLLNMFNGALVLSLPVNKPVSYTHLDVYKRQAPGTGRLTGARYLHQFGRNAQGEFVYRELTPDNAPQLNACLLYTSYHHRCYERYSRKHQPDHAPGEGTS